MSLKFLAGMDAAARIDRTLHEIGRLVDLRLADLPADQGLARRRGEDRPIARIAQPDARRGAAPFLIDAARCKPRR